MLNFCWAKFLWFKLHENFDITSFGAWPKSTERAFVCMAALFTRIHCIWEAAVGEGSVPSLVYRQKYLLRRSLCIWYIVLFVMSFGILTHTLLPYIITCIACTCVHVHYSSHNAGQLRVHVYIHIHRLPEHWCANVDQNFHQLQQCPGLLIAAYNVHYVIAMNAAVCLDCLRS